MEKKSEHLVGFNEMQDLEESPENRSEPEGMLGFWENRAVDDPWPFQPKISHHSRKKLVLKTTWRTR